MASTEIRPVGFWGKRQTKTLEEKWYLVALLPILLQLFIAIYQLMNCWDDGAITAAFARTWAHTGRIALTPGSPTVEGFSSVLWFLLLSLPSFFLHDPNVGLIWMKVLAAGFAILSLRLIYLIAWRQFGDRSAAIVSTLLLACCYPTVMEVQNGMEMNLAALLMLLLFYVLTRKTGKLRLAYACLLGLLLLLTRFEMPFTLMLLGSGFCYAAVRYQGRLHSLSMSDLGRIALVLIACFFFIALWRRHEFGVWMPNTVYAKRFPPYRDWSTPAKFASTRLEAMGEPFHILGPAILISFGVWIYALYRRRLCFEPFERIHPAILILGSGGFLFGAAFGANWGYDGRMIAAMVPFLILSIVGVIFFSVAQPSRIKITFALLLISQIFLWVRHIVRPPWAITMTAIEPIGIGADSVRLALHQDRLVVMMADVGSSSLCCDHLAVIDSGFLADPTLSHTGWPGFEAYFREVRPGLVETHSFWAQGSGIYTHGLLDGYSIVAANGVRYFLRNDLFAKLVDSHAGPVLPVASVPACLSTLPQDAAFSLTKRACLVLNNPQVRRSY